MVNYPVIAFKIANIVLGVKQNDVVSISGDIHNSPKDESMEDVLAEIPLVEELALAVRKKKAFPVIDLSTDNLKRRFLSEMPEDIYELPLSYYTRWVEAIDFFIDIGWRNMPQLYSGIEDKLFGKIKDSTQEIWNVINRHGKRILFLGFPTHSLAEFFNLEYDKLLAMYFKGLDCDYNRIIHISEELKNELIRLGSFKLGTFEAEQSEVAALDVTLNKSFAESIPSHPFMEKNLVLPGGKLEFEIDKERLTGVFVAECGYYANYMFRNIRIHFAEGKVYYVEFDAGVKGGNKFRNAIMNRSGSYRLCIGLNDQITESTGYYLYDLVMQGNVAIKMYSSLGEEIILTTRRAKLITDNEEHLLRDIIYG